MLYIYICAPVYIYQRVMADRDGSSCMMEPIITSHKVVEMFGESVRQHADLISAIYCMHYEFITSQALSSKPELRLQHLQHSDEYVVTVRGGVGIDTRALTDLKMQEVQLDTKCRSIVVDTSKGTTQYTISNSGDKAAYALAAAPVCTTVPIVVMKHNKSRSSLALAQKLSRRRMQRVIQLYTHSDRQIPEFDVFLYTPHEVGYVIMTINNVVHTSTKFIFGLLHDPIANIARIQFCPTPDDHQTFELRMWFDCGVHNNEPDHSVDNDPVPKRRNRLSRFVQMMNNPY